MSAMTLTVRNTATSASGVKQMVKQLLEFCWTLISMLLLANQIRVPERTVEYTGIYIYIYIYIYVYVCTFTFILTAFKTNTSQ